MSALDALLREQLQDTQLENWQTRRPTQLLVTHSIEEAVYLGQRIVVLSPRPGRVKAIVENPDMGTRAWRASEEFFARCTRVRALLDASAQTGATSAVNEAAASEPAPETETTR